MFRTAVALSTISLALTGSALAGPPTAQADPPPTIGFSVRPELVFAGNAYTTYVYGFCTGGGDATMTYSGMLSLDSGSG